MSKRGRRLPPSKKRAALLDDALAAVMVGKLPDVRGEETLGTVKIFDPYEERAWRDGHSARPVAHVKVVSLRDDPLGRLHARGQIDAAQYAAGRRWQKHHHDAEIGTLRSVDTTRDVVDGGRLPDPMTDRRRRAIAQMSKLDRALGLDGSALVRQILGERMFIKQVMAARGVAGTDMERYLGRRFRECLETLAQQMGLVGCAASPLARGAA